MYLPAQATEQTWYCRTEHSAMINLPMQRFISSSVRQQEVMISLSATSTVFTKIMLSEESKHYRSIHLALLPGIAPSPLCRRPTARAASSGALSPSDRTCCLCITPLRLSHHSLCGASSRRKCVVRGRKCGFRSRACFLLSKNHAIIPNEDYIIKLVRTNCSQQTNRFTES